MASRINAADNLPLGSASSYQPRVAFRSGRQIHRNQVPLSARWIRVGPSGLRLMEHPVEGFPQPCDAGISGELRVRMHLDFDGRQLERQRQNTKGLGAVETLRDAFGKD